MGPPSAVGNVLSDRYRNRLYYDHHPHAGRENKILMIPLQYLDIASNILRVFAFILLYIIIGFGPGFVIGVLLANRFPGRDKPLRIDEMEKNMRRAAEHNEQWHPDNPRWKQ